ncbi:MAG TPA: oxygenase MpaB family protein [Candidatus Limnocylindria bacterium]|nr:oxygenase MpaB family protein [Candidatus Limnocylindria bacterium]
MSATTSRSSLTDRLPRGGLFAPGSVSWRVDRESVVLAGGTCALLLQIAHPAVAAGVDAHSDFRADPFARLRRTLGASWSIVFGDRAAAERAIRRINAIHQKVGGVVPETGRPYRALDPALLMWVHATLVDTALRMYDRFVGPLDATEMDVYHREAAEVAIRLGVPEAILPGSVAEMRAWMDGLIAAGEVQVGPTALALLPAILYPTRFPPHSVWDVAHLASISVLHPAIRRQYGLHWNRRRERGMVRLAAASRRILPLLPPAVRYVPPARAGERARLSWPRTGAIRPSSADLSAE